MPPMVLGGALVFLTGILIGRSEGCAAGERARMVWTFFKPAVFIVMRQIGAARCLARALCQSSLDTCWKRKGKAEYALCRAQPMVIHPPARTG